MQTLVDSAEQWEGLYENFAKYMNFFLLGSFIFFACLSRYYIIYFFLAIRKPKKLTKGKIKHTFAILVPARNEDKVIKNLLVSLKGQKYPKDKYNVFVIVESKDDPTIRITEKMGFTAIIRKNLSHRRTKGFALDEAYQYIRENGLKFDCFMIFDADNVVNSDYLSLMNDCRNAGYQVGVGYRNFTNSSQNRITCCSGVLFSFMNQFTSNGRSVLFKKATLTGTGYYIDSKIVDDAGGWIWDGMTEDVQLTVYCYYHNISMHYYQYAQYFDEQSPKYSVMHKQHIRWVWGFFQDKRMYTKKAPNYGALNKFMYAMSLFEYNISIYPFLTFCIMETIATLTGLGLFIASVVTAAFVPELWTNQIPQNIFSWFILYFMYLYLTWVFVACLTFVIDQVRLKYKRNKILASVVGYMFFFADFLFAFFDGLIHKSKRHIWDQIEHEGTIYDEGARSALNGKKKVG
jgi:cellulose synthase/poly-beta-1,6-N-acetylglucosamine synthase-like glycosyltransferase